MSADSEMVDFLAEQVSGEERDYHAEEPVGLEGLPQATGLGGVEEETYRPMARDYFLMHAAPANDMLEDMSAPTELPTHEGYDRGPDEHAQLKRQVFIAAVLCAIVVGGGWVAITGRMLRQEGQTAAGAAPGTAQVERQLNEQFTAISKQFEAMRQGLNTNAQPATAETGDTAANPAVLSPGQIDGLRAALGAAAAATSTSTSP